MSLSQPEHLGYRPGRVSVRLGIPGDLVDEVLDQFRGAQLGQGLGSLGTETEFPALCHRLLHHTRFLGERIYRAISRGRSQKIWPLLLTNPSP